MNIKNVWLDTISVISMKRQLPSIAEDLKSGLWQLTVTSVTITYDGEENDGWDYSTTQV